MASPSRFRNLSDAALLELLHTAADRLPAEAAGELVRRGHRVRGELRAIVMDKVAWTQGLPEWWAPVHATYLLGAMETPETLVALLAALRWADAFDCDWVLEDLPSIFARLGAPAVDPLRAILADLAAGPGARSTALAALAAVSLRVEGLTEEVLDLAEGLVRDRDEDLFLRQSAANLLVDFRSIKHRAALKAFGREESRRHRRDPEYQGVFYDWELDELLEGAGESNLEPYRRDWMGFYDPEEIEHRQERWQREQEEDEGAPEGELPPGPTPSRDPQAPCPCGSGQRFVDCCFLRVH